MSFLDLAKKRFTSRSFLPKSVLDEKVMYVLEAARVAPTMGNSLSTRIVVLRSRESLRKLRIYVSTHDAPPCILSLCRYDRNVQRSN